MEFRVGERTRFQITSDYVIVPAPAGAGEVCGAIVDMCRVEVDDAGQARILEEHIPRDEVSVSDRQ